MRKLCSNWGRRMSMPGFAGLYPLIMAQRYTVYLFISVSMCLGLFFSHFINLLCWEFLFVVGNLAAQKYGWRLFGDFVKGSEDNRNR